MHRKYLDDIVGESYITNFIQGVGRGIRKYSLTTAMAGVLAAGSGYGQEPEAVNKSRYGQNQTEQEAQIEGQMKIAFSSNKDGNSEIYVMNANRDGLRNLTNDPVRSDSSPTWSPDGKKIIFTSYSISTEPGPPHIITTLELYVMNADGTEKKKLADIPTNTHPSWSPDGTLIAFMSNQDGNHEIYVMRADGSGQQNLTKSLSDETRPSWSPDGKKIAYVSGKFYKGASWMAHYEHSDIYVMNADGTGQKRLTETDKDSSPSWCPDGGKIAFLSQRDGNIEIYIMNADGTNQRNISKNHGTRRFRDIPDIRQDSYDGGISWSPDGRQIAFQSDRHGNMEIYVMDADGKNIRRLTNNTTNDSTPLWSPDGTMLAFESSIGSVVAGGSEDICIITSDRRKMKTLTRGSEPSWSPFLSSEIKGKKEKGEEISRWFKSPEGKYRIPAITEEGWTYILRPSNLINPEGKIELPKAGVDQFFKRYEKDESELASLLVKWLPVAGTLEEEFTQSKKLLVERDKWRWVEGSLTTIKIGDENGLQGKYIVDMSEVNKKLLTTYILVHRGSRAYEIAFAYTNRFPNPSQTLEKIIKNWQFTNGKK